MGITVALLPYSKIFLSRILFLFETISTHSVLLLAAKLRPLFQFLCLLHDRTFSLPFNFNSQIFATKWPRCNRNDAKQTWSNWLEGSKEVYRTALINFLAVKKEKKENILYTRYPLESEGTFINDKSWEAGIAAATVIAFSDLQSWPSLQVAITGGALKYCSLSTRQCNIVQLLRPTRH